MKKGIKVVSLALAVCVSVASCTCNSPNTGPGSDTSKTDSAKMDSAKMDSMKMDSSKKMLPGNIKKDSVSHPGGLDHPPG